MVATVAEPTVRTNPYVGPRSFQTGEHLYGRSREGAELVDLLIADRIVLLHSPSGAGKSSLINAVVIPQMQTEGFIVLPTARVNIEPPAGTESVAGFNRYASSVMRSLEDALDEDNQCPPDVLASMTLSEYIQDYRRRASQQIKDFDPKAALLIILDQFEEVIRLSAADQDAKHAFFAQLGEMLRDRTIWALIAIREDYIAAVEPYSRPIPNRLSTTYRLDFLDARSAIEAIKGPARDSGVVFEDDAAAQLVENLRVIRVQQPDGTAVDQPGMYVEPVQLQVVCRRMWEKAAGKGSITLQDVSEAGNVDDALSDYYQEHVAEAAAATGVSERQIREWFDRKLIALSGIRGQVLMEPEVSSGLPNKVIKVLQESYLVRADKRGNAVWFELAHDRLTRPIRRNNADWFAAHLNVFQRQADLWANQGRPDSLLLRGPAYLEAEQWAKTQTGGLSGAENDFLQECRKAHQALLRDRRWNLLVRVLAGLMTLLAGAALFFFFNARAASIEAEKQRALAVENARIADEKGKLAEQEAQRATTNAQIAHIRELAAQSLSNVVVDPELSITLGISAASGVDLTQPDMADAVKPVEDALRQALPAMRVEQVLKDPALSGSNPVSHAGTVWSVSFDPTGTRVATAGDDGTIKIWDPINGKLLHTVEVFTPAAGQRGVTSVAYSPDGKRLAAATGNGRVFLYNASDLTGTDTLPITQGAILGLAFSPDSGHLLIGGEGGVAEILDLQANTPPVILAGHDSAVQTVGFNQDGTRAATGDANGVAIVSDAATGNSILVLPRLAGGVNGIAFSPDGKRLATAGGEDRVIDVWDLADGGRNVISMTGGRDVLSAIAFTRDGANLISVGADRTVRFWETTHGRPGLVLYGHKDQIFGLALSPDGERIATSSKDRTVRIWNIAPEGSRELSTFDNGAPVYDLALSPDGLQMVTAGGDNIARVLNAKTGQLIFRLTGHNGPLEGVAYSPDGKEIATCSRDGTARIWDAISGKEISTFSEQHSIVWDIAFSRDGKQAATASQDKTVKIWDPATGKLLFNLDSIWGVPLTVAFSPKAPLLAAGYTDGHIVLWDPSTGKRVKILQGHTDAVEALAFRADGQMLASSGDDGNIILWDMDPVRLGDYQAPMSANGYSMFGLAFSSDGKYLFTGGADGTGTLWDLQDRHADFKTFGHTDRIYATAFSQDGQFLYSAGRDGTVRTFVFTLEELLKLAGQRTTRDFTQQECLQYLNAACPADVRAPVQGPAAAEVKRPSDTVPGAETTLRDANSSKTAADLRANGGDQLYLNLLERPFNGMEMNTYYPDIDITGASEAQARQWLYFTINLAGTSGDSLMGNYGIELDIDGDGRGDYLITSLTPGKDWSVNGVRIWEDKNNDVGNSSPIVADPPQTGDGYETLIFDQGTGDQPDLAWARMAPGDPTSVQLALQRSLINNDPTFAWLAWASRDAFKPAWFDYNDHFTQDEAGSPLKTEQPRLYPIKALAAVDNTCRMLVGSTPDPGQQVYCQPNSP
ncbi:MAG: hypothetical protein ACM3QS_05315 [Bacteroidota bacterium]